MNLTIRDMDFEQTLEYPRWNVEIDINAYGILNFTIMVTGSPLQHPWMEAESVEYELETDIGRFTGVAEIETRSEFGVTMFDHSYPRGR
jgi:hypothetical protein